MKDEAYREALRHLSPELIGETVASGIDIRLFIEVGIDAGYEAAIAAERERVCEWRRSEPFLLTSECGYTAEVEELDNPFCPKCGGLVAEREKEGGEDATNK